MYLPLSSVKLGPRLTSSVAYDPPSVTTPDFAPDRSGDRDDTSPRLQSKSPSQMRELAKGALLSLAPHGIRYSELVREGVDPDLLQQLYEEIGIKDSRPDLSAGVRTSQAIDMPEQKEAASAAESDINRQSTVLPDKPTSGLPGIPVAVDMLDTPPVQQNLSQSYSDPMEPTKSMEAPLQQTEQASSSLAHNRLATPASNVAMERKDRIAQLLAAKTGKPAPVRSKSDATPMHAQVHLSPAMVRKANAPVASSEAAAAPDVPNRPLLKSLKNKAQTELVRQKMESLKKEAEAKAQAQNQSQASIAPKPIMPADDTNMASTTSTFELSPSTELTQQNITHSDTSFFPTRSATSDFQPLTKSSTLPNYAHRIPGLFMTSDEPAQAEEQLSTKAASHADKSTRISSDLEYDLDQNSGTSSARDRSSVSGSLTEYNLTSLGNHGSSSRLSQKRPLASDSFDEPTPPAKRLFGRKGSVEHIEIDVSDEERDDGSDGIGMDIDEDSQASELLINNSAPGKEASERDTLVSVTTAKLPERQSAPLQSTTIGLNLSTPTKEKDKEDLWLAKNLEIEAMRKRIAEMEQRRKAKQSLSQAQSPQSSLPGTPATPILQAALPTPAAPNPVSVLQTYGSSGTQPFGNVHAVVQKATNGDYYSLGMNPVSRLATESPSHSEDLRKKIARRKELQDGLPNLDAEVQATQLKLAQAKARLAAIKRDAEKREAEIREARRREDEIVAEASKLEEQLNMGLKGRSRFSEELQSLGADLEAVPEVHTTFTESPEPDRAAFTADYVSPRTDLPAPPGTQDMPDVSPAAKNGSIANVDRKGTTVDELFHKTDNGALGEEQAVGAEPSDEKFADERGSNVPTATSGLRGDGYRELDDKSRRDSQNPGNLEPHQSSIMPRRSDNESVNVDEIVEESSGNLNGVVAGLDNDNDGSVSMSDSGTDDYEPAEISDLKPNSDMESDGYDPEDGLLSSNLSQGEVSDIDDDYEPAEEVEPVEVDLGNAQPVSMGGDQCLERRDPNLANRGFSDPNSPASADKPAVNDTEDRLELSDANSLTKPQDLPQQSDAGAEADNVSQFSPEMRAMLILAGLTSGSSGRDALHCL